MDFLAWIPHRLASGHNPLFMGSIDYPQGVNLAWEQPLPIAAVLAWPVTATVGPVAAYNVIFVLVLALDGWCTYLWLRRHVGLVAALIAGAVIEVGPFAIQHAYGHLNLIAFFTVPLLLMAIEHVVASRRAAWKIGVSMGVLAAVQLYFAEEILALVLIGAAIAVVVAAIANWRDLQSEIPRWATALGVGVVVCLALAGPMLIYQFFGPNRITEAIHPPNLYVTDLANLIIPTPATLINAGSLSSSQVSLWTGENDAYVGLPLLALSIYAAIRWRKERPVVVVVITTMILEILSLGSHLHISGHDTLVRLPSVVLAHLPVLDNILPGRFALIAGFGFAFLLARTLDRTLLRHPLKAPVGSTLSLLSVLLLIPNVLPAATWTVPPYFTSQAGARALPEGTVALVGPYIDNADTTPVVMLWQAESDFHITLVDGLAIHLDPDGHVAFLQGSAFGTLFHAIQVDGTALPLTDSLRSELVNQFKAQRISRVILGPMPHRDVAVSFLTTLMGTGPHDTLGVSVWSVS